MYIVVNNSGKIEVVDRDYLKSIATINGLISPRYISVLDTKGLCYKPLFRFHDNSRSDFKHNFRVYRSEASFGSDVRRQSKAFVAHWAGGNKVFVINTPDNTVIDSIEVGMEPESMVFDGTAHFGFCATEAGSVSTLPS